MQPNMDPQMWHLSVLLFADERARLQRLVDAHNDGRKARGERVLTQHEYLAANICRWLAEEEKRT